MPGIWNDTRSVGRTLQFQNPWAGVHRWLLHRKDIQQTDTFVVVSVPEDTVQTLLQHDRRLGYLLGSVYLKFQGQNGKFTELPPNSAEAQTAGDAATTRMEVAKEHTTAPDCTVEVEAEPLEQGSPSTPADLEEDFLLTRSSEEEEGDLCTRGLGEMALTGEEGDTSPNDGIPPS